MGLAKTSSSAVNLLIDIGYFPVHVNLDLLKLRIPTDHLEKITSAAQSLLSDSSDPDEVIFICLIVSQYCSKSSNSSYVWILYHLELFNTLGFLCLHDILIHLDLKLFYLLTVLIYLCTFILENLISLRILAVDAC